MKLPFSASPPQARQTKDQFAHPQDDLSLKLEQTVWELSPLGRCLAVGTMSLLVFGAIAWTHYSQVEEGAILLISVQVQPLYSLKERAIREVKMVAFSFQEFGTVDGKVVNISLT